MKTFWKIFSAFFAFLMSILLVVSLIVFPAVSFLTDNAEPSKLVDIIMSSGLLTQQGKPSARNPQILLSENTVAGLPEGVDLDTLMESLEELANSGVIDVEELMEDLEIPEDVKIDQEQLKQELTQSQAVQTLVSTYAEDIINAAAGTGEPPALTTETVLEILQPHMEEIVTIVENNLPEDVKIDREKVSNAIDKAASAAFPALVDKLPPAQEVAQTIVSTNDMLPTVMSALNFVRSGKLRTIALCVVAALIVLVFLFRLPKINGLRWVGISGLVGAVFVGGLGYLLQAKPVLDSLLPALGEVATLAMPLISTLASTFVTFAIIYSIAGLVLVVGNGVLNAVVIKKAQ